MSEEMTAADVLEQAADLIQSVGFCKGGYVRYRASDDPTVTGYCAVGAMTTVALGDDLSIVDWSEVHVPVFYDSITALIVELTGKDADADEVIFSWNDSPSRKAEEVIDTMKRVAKDLRNTATPD